MTEVVPAFRHREAYPRFDTIQALKALDQGPSVCLFLNNGHILGQLIVADSNYSHVTIAYVLQSSYIRYRYDHEIFCTRFVNNTVQKGRVTIECPFCAEQKFSLYYKSDWACARCHGLLFRSQLVSKGALMWECFDQLQGLAKKWRPKGMHNRTYQALLDELSPLRKSLRNQRRCYAADDHSYEVQSVWKPVSELDDLWLRDYVIRNGDIVARRAS